MQHGRIENDRGEPSWQGLGRMIEEAAFLQAAQRAHFLSDWWGVETSDELPLLLHVAGTHPGAPFVRSFDEELLASPAKRSEALREVKFTDLKYSMTELQDEMRECGPDMEAMGVQTWRALWRRFDETSRQLLRRFLEAQLW